MARQWLAPYGGSISEVGTRQWTSPYGVSISERIAVGGEYLYKGAGNRASHYLGAAADDSARYLGTKAGIYPS